MVDARLPRPTITFYAPSSEQRSGNMHFILIDRDKVLATDQTGRASIYDAGLHAMCTVPSFSKPKDRPISSIASRLSYVCEHGGVGWHCRSLPTPPYHPAHIQAYTVVGGSELWVSTEEDEGTYSFDTGRGAWAKQGDWTLPFCGLAEYVPELKLWFGLSSKKGSYLFCAFDLAAAVRRQSAPTPRNVWEDLRPPKEWLQVGSYLVHLGSARFCIARLFCDTTGKPGDMDDFPPWKMLAVFTAVEVVPYGNRGLRMIEHKSVGVGRAKKLGTGLGNCWSRVLFCFLLKLSFGKVFWTLLEMFRKDKMS
ncbi:hypothetical protein SETIT_9G310800v2 [Setaria italica]|uniref:F-box associated domain-containing protein n=1 Tax=Setaria italica TaxID=4555 RepID=A0A368SMN8_SETIT|nr:hypothetical protein SETIT_9G310800v2 [Setaria italica]